MKTILSILILLAGLTGLNAQFIQIGSDIYGEKFNSISGKSVSMSSDGSRVAIGAIWNNGEGNGIGQDYGHVRIFEDSAGIWVQLGDDIDGEGSWDESGYSVSLSGDGNRVAIGAPYNDSDSSNMGHVRIYEYSAGIWVQLGNDIDGEYRLDESGSSVSLSSDGSRVAIGATNNKDNGWYAGHVRIYEFSAGSWLQLGSDIDGESFGNYSGYSVSMSSDGNRVLIGATGNSGSFTLSGHARIFEYSLGSWVQVGSDIDGEAYGNWFGYSASMSSNGNRVAIGAINNNDNGALSGHVRIFELIAGSWVQMGGDIDGESADDHSGWSVSLSGNGSRVVIGAPYNADNGIRAGQVRIYEYSAGSWSQMGSDIDGDGPDNSSGTSVSISRDGSRVAIGAPGNSDFLVGAGMVRVFDLNPPSLGISCPAYVTLNADLKCQATYSGPMASGTPGTTITSTPALPATFNEPGTYTITYAATDAAGNSLTCSQIVTVIDNDAPVINCPADVTLIADLNCQATYSGPTATFFDNCSSASLVVSPTLPATFSGQGSYTITYTTTDAAGNMVSCNQQITVVSSIVLEAGDDKYVVINTGSGPSPLPCTSLAASATGGAGGYAYAWSPTTGLSAPNSDITDACPTAITVYYVTVTDAGGCFEVDSVTVLVVNIEESGSLPTVDNNDNKIYVCDNGLTVEANANANCNSSSSLCYLLSHGATLGACTNKFSSITNQATEASMLKAYPNPFNKTTTIDFVTGTNGQVSLDIYDMKGAKVSSLYRGEVEAGEEHQINFDATGLSQNMYIVRLTTNNEVKHLKLLMF